MSYAVWVPLIALFYITTAYVTTKSVNNGGSWFWFLVILNGLPIWPVVTKAFKYSESELLFVAVVFDITLMIAAMAGFCYFTGVWQKLGLINWIGLITILAGTVMLKYKVF